MSADIPGHNEYGPIVEDDVIFAEGEITYNGQMIGVVVAEDAATAARGANAVVVEGEELPFILTIQQAIEADSFYDATHQLSTGDVESALGQAANVIEGAARKARRAGVRFIIAGAAPQVRRMLFQHGVRPPLVRYKTTTRSALEQLRNGRQSETPAAATW